MSTVTAPGWLASTRSSDASHPPPISRRPTKWPSSYGSTWMSPQSSSGVMPTGSYGNTRTCTVGGAK